MGEQQVTNHGENTHKFNTQPNKNKKQNNFSRLRLFSRKFFGERKPFTTLGWVKNVKQKINRSNKSTLHPSSGDGVMAALSFGGLENIPLLHKKHDSLVASLLVLELRH